MSVPTSASLWLGRWLRTHIKLFHHPLVRISETPSSAEGTIFWRDPFFPFCPRPPGHWDRDEQSSREGPPPPNQSCPRVCHLMALPTDLTSPPVRSHRAPILELFGVGPLRPSSVVTDVVVRAVCPQAYLSAPTALLCPRLHPVPGPEPLLPLSARGHARAAVERRLGPSGVGG
jgi:hypothetical protein